MPVFEREYFGDEPPSLEMHFHCVDAFDIDLASAPGAAVRAEREGSVQCGDASGTVSRHA